MTDMLETSVAEAMGVNPGITEEIIFPSRGKVTAESGKPVSIGAVMTGGAFTRQRERQENDWYPTPPQVTHGLLNHFKIKKMGDIWEPCAGNGAIMDVLNSRLPSSKVWAHDIAPQREDIVQANFLEIEKPPGDDVTIITNPPFNLAEKFIRHGFEIGVKRQAMLLKSTFFHASRRTKLFEQYRPSHVLPLNWRVDFMNLGRPTMEVSWFCWLEPCAKTTTYDIIRRP